MTQEPNTLDNAARLLRIDLAPDTLAVPEAPPGAL
jgi:hypothetical protein